MRQENKYQWVSTSPTLQLHGDLVALEGRHPSELDPLFSSTWPISRSWVRIPKGKMNGGFATLTRLNPTLLVVDLDHYEDTDQAVDDLLELRSYNNLPVTILCSDTFARHDLSLERSAICDVSVRLPISDNMATQIIQQAWRNNRAMRVRRSQQEAIKAKISSKCGPAPL